MKAAFLLVSGAAISVALLYMILAEVERYIDEIRKETEDEE